MYQIALLRINGLHRGGKRTVKLIRRNRLDASVVAHGILQHLVFHPRHAHRQTVAQEVPHREKHDNQDDRRTDPKPFAARLRSCFSHAFNQSQYIRLD